MSTNNPGQSRHSKGAGAVDGKGVGGQFKATKLGENPGSGLTGTRRDEQVQALSELADSIIYGESVVADDVEAALALVPNVPRHMLSDQMWHDVLSATLHRDGERRDKAIGALVDLDAREARWRSDPTFTSPTQEVTESGNGPSVYTTVVGGKYTGYRDVADVAKDVRGDLKAAVKAGYLPDGLSFAVRTSKYAGGQSMTVDVRGMDDEDIYDQDPISEEPGRRYSQSSRELRTRVAAIAGAYGRDTTDVQTDYCNVTYFAFVQVEDSEHAELRARESAQTKAARDRKAA
jgi:hypothetical protein